MKKNSYAINILLVILACSPLIYMAIIWNSIPERVPLHFDAHMKADKIGNKINLWPLTAILSLVSIGIYLLFLNLHHIDPKRKGETQSGRYRKLGIGLLVFMTVMNFAIVISAAQGELILANVLFPLIGLLFAFLGNNMNNIKPNYFAGFRLPWTLSDDENWRKTHQLASKLWFWGGIFLVITSFVLPFHFILPLFVAIVLVLVIMPSIYSYRLYKNKQ